MLPDILINSTVKSEKNSHSAILKKIEVKGKVPSNTQAQHTSQYVSILRILANVPLGVRCILQ